MQDIDFLSDDKTKKGSSKKKEPYIEYSKPASFESQQVKPQEVRKRKPFFSFLQRKKEPGLDLKKEKIKKEKIKKVEKEEKRETEFFGQLPKEKEKEKEPKEPFFHFRQRQKEEQAKKHELRLEKEPVFPILKKELTKLPPSPKKPEVEKEKMEKREEKPEREKPSGFDVNLIPEEFLDELRPARKVKVVFIVAIVCCLVIGLVYGLICIYQYRVEGKIKELNQQISSAEKEIAQYQEVKKQAEKVSQVAKEVDDLLGTHIYWTQFFDLLEKYTISNVYYRSMTGNVTSGFVLSATAKSYQDISEQIAVFERADDFVKTVEVSSASTSQVYALPANSNQAESGAEASAKEVVNFDIKLTVKPDIFYFKD